MDWVLKNKFDVILSMLSFFDYAQNDNAPQPYKVTAKVRVRKQSDSLKLAAYKNSFIISRFT